MYYGYKLDQSRAFLVTQYRYPTMAISTFDNLVMSFLLYFGRTTLLIFARILNISLGDRLNIEVLQI
jgi:hypothetical protein